MKIALKIFRYNPKTDSESRYQTYTLEADPCDRILDALIRVYRYQDGSLSFRKSCAHGVCGSDAMRINGTERLACKTLVKDVVSSGEGEILIEPLRHMKIQKDLMVEQAEFLDRFKKVEPFLIPAEELPEQGEFIQTQEDREAFDDGTKMH